MTAFASEMDICKAEINNRVSSTNGRFQVGNNYFGGAVRNSIIRWVLRVAGNKRFRYGNDCLHLANDYLRTGSDRRCSGNNRFDGGDDRLVDSFDCPWNRNTSFAIVNDCG